MNPMWVDIDTSESPLIIIYLRPSPSRFLGTEEKQWCNFFSFNSQQRYSQLYPLPPASPSLTTIRNNSSSSISSLGFIQTHGIPNSFFCVIQIGKRKCGKLGRRQRLLLVVSTVDQRLQSEWVFNSCFTEVFFRCAYKPSTIPLRGYQITTIPYTDSNGHGPGHHHQQSHSVGGTTATSSLLFPPNFDFHTG